MLERMNKLVHILNEASKAYYSSTGESPLTDVEYDRYLRELDSLERETGSIFPESPTKKVGFKDEDGKKIKHDRPILSLKSTKEVEDILEFIGDHDVVLSWKLDGVSIVLYYVDGKLEKALSRGDGHIGKDITKNVILMKDTPLEIHSVGSTIIRGEGCISVKDFDVLKQTTEGEKYSNPRNLASGLINSTKTTSILLNSMTFIAHSVIYSDDNKNPIDSRMKQLLYLESLGFKVVEHNLVDFSNFLSAIDRCTEILETYPYPVDGLVFSWDDLLYSEVVGCTGRYPRHSLAFKWPDEVKETIVKGMTWSVSKTGLITPIVEFEPIFLEGTIVKRANLHSLKTFNNLSIGVGDVIRVYKANKIIPHVEENLTRSKTEEYPRICPVCGEFTTVITNDVTEKLYCDHCKEE